MKKKDQTVRVHGVEFPRWQDCKKCKKKLVCEFRTWAYTQPCYDCQLKQEPQKAKGLSMSQALQNNQVASVFEGNGKQYFVNNRGNVIKEEKIRELPVGKKNWR